MRRLHVYNALLIISMLASAPPAATFAAPDTLRDIPSTIQDGEQGVVLLQDGGLLDGTVTKAVDWFVIGRANSQLQIAISRVLFIGHTRREAYEYRLANATQPTGDAHLALAEWCLRYNLADEAGQELETARRLGASEIRTALLERRLAATRLRLTQKTTPTPNGVVQAAAEQEVPSTISRDLPNGALETFTRKVQPVLVNNCTLSKCHEPGGAQAFQLNRAILRGESNRRTTMQNLAATLALIDRAHPEASPLLTVPRRTHGGMTGPVLGVRHEQAFKHLADWVALLAPQKTTTPAGTEPAEPAAAMVAGDKRSSRPRQPGTPASTAVVQAIAHDVSANADPTEQGGDSTTQPEVTTKVDESRTLRQPHRLRVGATAQKWRPRDPFDPEIFNRMQDVRSQRTGCAQPPPAASESASASKPAASKR